ncbi:hypothetical protein L1987_18803 [Smallanthus sonchifolius]|uniref:Uncharacterized protein n=1 Tax=Smallanthus sonchifolius TaxID=185202 RepID=A0ACB9J2S9_9ASTR|nr:hypothetical protein L1987_18803 [Smallanthus sonchifolius]
MGRECWEIEKHEEHMSPADSEPERFTLEPTVRTTIAEEVGLVLQATIPDALTKALKESTNDLKELLKEGNSREIPHRGRRRHYESDSDSDVRFK